MIKMARRGRSEWWFGAWAVAAATIAGCASATAARSDRVDVVPDEGTGVVVVEEQRVSAAPEAAPQSPEQRPGHPEAYAPDAPLAAHGERLQPPGQDAPRPGDRCVEAHNAQGTSSTNCGGTNLAWQYIPTVGYRLEQVDMYTDAESFVLLDDAGGRPGQPLARGSFRQGNEPGWRSARLDLPVDLEAGRTYWLWHSPGICSIVESGVTPVYWTNFSGMDATNWEGPWRGHAFTARMYGTCR
jgi:hypothetical protein